jgi:hypothetical protein
MSTPLVVKYNNWNDLLREFIELKILSFLKPYPEMVKMHSLWPVVTLAWWIAHQEKSLLDKKHLNIVVAGAKHNDATNQGMWFSLLPYLVGKLNLTLSINLVGHEAGCSMFIRQPPDDPERIVTFDGILPNSSSIHKCSIADYYSDKSIQETDLIVMFHPGMNVYSKEWMEDSMLSTLINSNIPMFATSFGEDDYIVDKLILESYGCSDIGDPIKNPYSFDNIAALSWLFSKSSKTRLKIIDQHKHDEALAFGKLICTSFLSDNMVNNVAIMSRETNFNDALGTDALDKDNFDIVHLANNFALDFLTNEIIVIANHIKAYGTDIFVTGEDIRTYPGDNAGREDKIRWCEYVVSKYNLSLELYYGFFDLLQSEIFFDTGDSEDTVIFELFEESINSEENYLTA